MRGQFKSSLAAMTLNQIANMGKEMHWSIEMVFAFSKLQSTIQFPIHKQRGTKMSVQSAVQQMVNALQEANTNLETARQNVIRYESEVATITGAYEALKAALPADLYNSTAPAKKGARKAKGRKTEFPATPAEFWHDLVKGGAGTTGEILIAAAAKLGFSADDAEKMAVLKPRMASNLANLIKAKAIKAKGERHDKVYSDNAKA